MVLPNGLRVFLLEDHELGLISGSLVMKGGSRGEPADKVGLSAVTASVQRAGGTTLLPGRQLDDTLEDLGADLEVSAGSGSLALSFSGLREDASTLLDLLAQLAMHPAFPESKLERTRTLLLTALDHRNDQTSGIPRRELAKILYGKDSVFAREPSPAQVQDMTRADLVSYWSQWERPDGAILGLCGDFDTPQMADLVRAKLGGWAPQEGQPPTRPPLPNSPPNEARPTTIFLVDKKGAGQVSYGNPKT
jgi:zinc protease